MLISAVVVKIQAYYISGAIFRSTRERTKKLLTLDRVWPIRMKYGDILLCQKVCWPPLRQSIDSLLILPRGESCRNTGNWTTKLQIYTKHKVVQEVTATTSMKILVLP